MYKYHKFVVSKMHSLRSQENFPEEENKEDISKKMDQENHNYSNRKKSYEKLGNAGIGGSLYQIHLLTMCLLNGLRKVENWRLSTEDKKAAQLDDLIFEYLPSESAILLQAKHKEDERKEVTYNDLMSVNKNSEFGLPKYFFSYQEVKNKFKVQNVCICTNLKLDDKTRSVLREESVDPDSVLHFEGAENVCYGFSGCSLPGLKQNIQMYQDKNLKNKEVIISDEDINDYLIHLKFFPNCLGDKNVKNIVQQTISQTKFSENLNIEMIQKDIHEKMTDWFKAKKGRYLTEVEAKAFFCDMRSNKYCEDLKLYDIRFKGNNLPLILQALQGNEKRQQQNGSKDPKRVSHIIPDEEYMLNVVKIYQALPPHHKKKALFVNPEETIEVQRQIIDAFEVQHYTILVMVCPNNMEETIAEEMCNRMMEILDTHKYKHVILIAEERNKLATQLKDANISYYEAITDNVTFADLEETTQETFKRKKLINFQGKTMSLEELFTSEDDFNQTVNSEMLVKLARGDKSEVGLELPPPDHYYISRSFNRSDQNIYEEDLWRSTEVSEGKVILISDSAGMGKSCVLISLAISIKRDNPHLWLIRFDLSNYTNTMRTTLEEGRNSVSIMELLNSQETSKLKSEFGKKLFTTPKRVVLMLDGVDEVSPTYTELVINLIRDSLAQVNLAKIFVTARPHMSKDLGKISELQSLTLEPFSKDNQIDFLTKYWTENLEIQDDVRKSKCNIFAEGLIANISVWINEKHQNDFAGIPLQTRMLAEIFQEKNQIGGEDHDWEGCKEFLSPNNEEPKLPTRIDLTQLYKLFIDKKRDIFIKNSNPSGHPLTDDVLNEQFEECHRFNCALALKVIFDSDERLRFFTCYKDADLPIPSTFEDNFMFRVGLVQRQGERIDFLHRTFAEYFTVDCLLIELERNPVHEEFQQFFMTSILLHKEFYVIRAFLDSRMPNVWHLIENNFCSYFRRNRVSEWALARYLKIFATEGCAKTFQCLIECIDKEQRETLSKTVGEMYLMDDVLYSVTRYSHSNILKLLLELNETFNKEKKVHKQFLAIVDYNLESSKFQLHQVDKTGKNILGRTEAVLMGRFEEVELLVEEAGADINIRDNNGATALHRAAYLGGLELVRYLVEEAGADINVKGNDGETALHGAVLMRQLAVVKYLVEQAGADINAQDNDGETALHEAVLMRQLGTVKYLVEEAGADVNAKNNSGETALHRVAYWGGLEIIKYLVKEARADINVKDNGGETVLHRAAYWGGLEIVKYLVKEAGADVNAKNNNGETALHRAVLKRQLEIVRFLVEEAGADINVEDNDGETTLHRAVYWGEFEIVKYLLEEAGADINFKYNDGDTALHRAANWGRLQIVKFLVEETGADINVKNNNGETALHRAILMRQLQIVKYLVEEAGADINVKYNDGKTALHKAAYEGKFKIVKFLMEETEADLNVKGNDGETALHEAVRMRQLEIVKYLVNEAGADVNVKDNDGETALHYTVIMRQLETVKFLVEEVGADINIQNNNGETALHTAANEGELEIVKYLVEETGADITVKDNNGETALHRATKQGNRKVVKFLSNSNRCFKIPIQLFCRKSP